MKSHFIYIIVNNTKIKEEKDKQDKQHLSGLKTIK